MEQYVKIQQEYIKKNIFDAISMPDNRKDCWIWKGFNDITDDEVKRYTFHHLYIEWIVYEVVRNVGIISHERPFQRCSTKGCVNPYHIIRYWSKEHFWYLANACDVDQCWEWEGDLTGRLNNQPAFNIRPYRRRSASRLAIKFMFDIDVTTQIKRTCKNSNCVNPWHMRYKT